MSPTVFAELNAAAPTEIGLFVVDNAFCNLCASWGNPTEESPHWSSVQWSSGEKPDIFSIATIRASSMFISSSLDFPDTNSLMRLKRLLVNGIAVAFIKAENPTVRVTTAKYSYHSTGNAEGLNQYMIFL
jgi:hypothetical protein